MGADAADAEATDRRRRIRGSVLRLVLFVFGVYFLFIIVFLNRGS